VETSGDDNGNFKKNRVYNKPNGCSATGALAPGPDHHHHHQAQKKHIYTLNTKIPILVSGNKIFRELLRG
jgi:hypothetical protein